MERRTNECLNPAFKVRHDLTINNDHEKYIKDQNLIAWSFHNTNNPSPQQLTEAAPILQNAVFSAILPALSAPGVQEVVPLASVAMLSPPVPSAVLGVFPRSYNATGIY